MCMCVHEGVCEQIYFVQCTLFVCMIEVRQGVYVLI